MSVASAFFKRDFSLNLSYRMSFSLQLVGILFSVASTYFVAKLFGTSLVPQLSSYGGSYFNFTMIGIAFYGYLNISLTSFSQSIRDGQVMGTLEIMLLSPTRLASILLSSSLWSYFLTTINVVLYLVIGTFMFGFNMHDTNIVSALLVLILSIVSFSGIGIASAAMVLIVKKGDPISTVYGSISSLLGGVFYPITVLPHVLVIISRFLPLTYALDAMRLAMLKGYSVYQLRVDILALLGFTVVLTPCSLFLFRWALARAKKEGSLVHY